MHTLINLCGSIPTFIWLTEGKVYDMNGLDVISVEPEAYYLLDKGYVSIGFITTFKSVMHSM